MELLLEDDLIAGCLSSLALGPRRQYKNMAVVPLFSPLSDGPEYLTLKEGLERDLATIAEVSLGGSVPRLKVVNRAELPVLLVDGEELIGARQNRVLNTSMLLKEKSETEIPVSCTEQGRWHYTSHHFGHAGHINGFNRSPFAKAAKSSFNPSRSRRSSTSREKSSRLARRISILAEKSANGK